jgi:hypothetical protein
VLLLATVRRSSPSLQIEYYDDKRCPPLVQAAKLRRMEKPIAVMVENA